MQRTSCHSIKKSQNKAKRPNIFFKAKQEIKKPKSSYLAAKKPSYQPCFSVIYREYSGGVHYAFMCRLQTFEPRSVMTP